MFHQSKICAATILFLTLISFSLGQGKLSTSEWKALNERDIAKWARKTGLSSSIVRKLLDATEGKWNEENQYLIENIDATRLAHRHQTLLSTYAAGTGHCMKMYVVEKKGKEYRSVWSDFGITGFFPTSVLRVFWGPRLHEPRTKVQSSSSFRKGSRGYLVGLEQREKTENRNWL